MSPSNIKKARSSVVTRPVVQSVSATRKFVASLRRLGADQATIDKVVRQPPARPAG
jgi:predicted metal-dependent phosphotriesterase family hydrolase